MIPCLFQNYSFPHLILFVSAFIASSSTLQVVPSSSCSSICLDDPQNSSSPGTSGDNIVCKDSQYNTTTNGTRFQSCIDCQLSSAAVDQVTGQTNLGWALYNLRYAIDWCIFGYPDNHNAVSTPCLGSCKPIQEALKANLTDPIPGSAYGYCQNGSFMAGVDLCASCNALVTDQSYPSNFMKVLKAACQQQPQPGASLGITGSIFSSTPIVSKASASSAATATESGLPVGAKVGIGLGVPAAVLAILFIFVLWYLRSKTRQTGHQRMDERWGDRSISTPLPGWSQPRSDAEETSWQNEGSTNYYQPPYQPHAPNHRSDGGVPERVLLQDLPVPRPKRPVPAVSVDTRNLHRGRNAGDPGPHSLFD